MKTLKAKPASTPIAGLIPLPANVADLLTVVKAPVTLADMVLAESTRSRLAGVIREHAAAKAFAAHGLTPSRKLLLVGPPGVGKSMTAAALATCLDVPLLRVNLHAVVGQFLGETARRLGAILDHIKTTAPAVFLFDEFDALAGARGTAETDVGEMRRACNSLLQFVEFDESPCILVAATNHGELIDRAMFRRFDEIIHYDTPTRLEASELVRRVILGTSIVGTVDFEEVGQAGWGIGHADLVAACRRACKDALLDGGALTTDMVTQAIAARCHA